MPQGLPPVEAFLESGERAAVEEAVRKALRDLGAESVVDRDRASHELSELGRPAEVALLRELGSSGSAVVRRAGLRALFRLGPSAPAQELAWSWAESPNLPFDRRAFAALELGGPFGAEHERAERASRLGRLIVGGGPLAEVAALALVRLRARGAELGALRALLGSAPSHKLRGALALYLGQVDPEALPAIAELGARSKGEWLRAAAWLALADAGRSGLPEVLSDLSSEGVVLGLCAALASIPRDEPELDLLAQRLAAEPRSHVVGGLALAFAASRLPRAEEVLVTRASDLALRARSALLQAGVALRSPRLVAAVHRRSPIDARERAADFAALAAIRCFPASPLEALVEGDAARSSAAASLLDDARRHLEEAESAGAPEAALALVLYGREVPAEARALALQSPELGLVLRLSELLARGEVDASTVRRVALALALRRGVDPRAWLDLARQHLAVSALGHEATPFQELRARESEGPLEPGPNDLFLPSLEPLPPVARSSDYYADLVFWLRTKPFRTTVELYLGR